MVFVYIRIYFAAKRRARRGIRKQPKKPPNEQVRNIFSLKTFLEYTNNIVRTHKIFI